MRPWRDISPKIGATFVGGVVAAIALALLARWGVPLDTDLGELVRDLVGLDLGTLDVTARQAVNAAAALASGYMWPEASWQELEAEDEAELVEPGERDG